MGNGHTEGLDPLGLEDPPNTIPLWELELAAHLAERQQSDSFLPVPAIDFSSYHFFRESEERQRQNDEARRRNEINTKVVDLRPRYEFPFSEYHEFIAEELQLGYSQNRDPKDAFYRGCVGLANYLAGIDVDLPTPVSVARFSSFDLEEAKKKQKELYEKERTTQIVIAVQIVNSKLNEEGQLEYDRDEVFNFAVLRDDGFWMWLNHSSELDEKGGYD